MTPGELATLGQYVCGPHWRTALAGPLGVTPRAVQYWAAGSRRISDRQAAAVVALARSRYQRRLGSARADYLGIVERIETPQLRAALLAA